MNNWTESVARLLSWRSAMPKQMHLPGIFVHISLVLALPLAAIGLLLVPYFTSLDGEWGAAAITIPSIWSFSLAVRILAQWFSVGARTGFEFVIGPTGNLSHEYSQLSGPKMMTYAVVGQAVTLLAAVVALLMLGAAPSSPVLTLASVLELQTGWHWNAVASQLLWVNSFMFAMHLLPASPFDARALYVGWCHISHSAITPGSVHRSLASVDSHIGTAAASCSLAMIVTRMLESQSAGVWHFLLMVSIYLLVVSQIEAYSAQQADDFLEPPMPRRRQRPQLASYPDSAFSKFAEYDEDPLDIPSPHEVLDVDEILRKLHREGQDSLSAFEKEALLSASRELKARRQSRS